MVTGNKYEWKGAAGLDIWEGITIKYTPGISAEKAAFFSDTEHIQFTSWCGVAVWIDRNNCKACSFVVSKNGKWEGPKKDWVEQNQERVSDAMQKIGEKWHVSKTHDGKVWQWRLDGWMCIDGKEVVKIPGM